MLTLKLNIKSKILYSTCYEYPLVLDSLFNLFNTNVMKTHSIVIVEDHTLLSHALESLVNSFEKFKVLYTCINGRDLLNKLHDISQKPDIILMDVNMPVLNGINATQFVKKEYPSIDVVALSVEENEETIIQMLQAGACSYLVKDVEKKILETALLEVIYNGYYHTTKVANILVKLLNPNRRAYRNALKDRELEFIKYACSELTYKEIARKMFLSPKTIDGYRSNLFQKLNTRNRVGLVIYAIKNKIFTP